jgi:hypothetical protein
MWMRMMALLEALKKHEMQNKKMREGLKQATV